MATLDDEWESDTDSIVADTQAGSSSVSASGCGQAKGKAKAKPKAKGKAKAAADPAAKKCFAASCQNNKTPNSKWCKVRHVRPFENMKYQAEKSNELAAFEQVARRTNVYLPSPDHVSISE